MGLIQYHQITCQPVNQAICIFSTVPIVFFVILFQYNVLLYYYCIIVNCALIISIQLALWSDIVQSYWSRDGRIGRRQQACIPRGTEGVLPFVGYSSDRGRMLFVTIYPGIQQ